MKVSLILVAILLLSMPLIFAGVVYTEDVTLNIKIYDNTLNITDEYSSFERTYKFNIIKGTNLSISSDDLVEYKEFSFVLAFEPNESLVGSSTVERYATCLNEKADCETLKASLNTGFNTCAEVRDECIDKYEGENVTSCKGELDSCNLRVQQKDIEISGKAKDITSLEEEKVDTKNSKWFYAIGGVAAGVFGLLVYQGKIGDKAKEKSREEFNPQQAS